MTNQWIKGFCLSLIFLIGISSQSTAQKTNLSKKALNERITNLEKENEQLKAELAQMRAEMGQFEQLIKNLPAQNLKNAIQPASKNTIIPVGEAKHNSALTTIAFDNMEHDFGKINHGEAVSHVFKFTNTGEHPLLITNARGSCGCTVPQWPKEEILPGEQGEIKVTFNSKGKSNQQAKSVTLTANTNPANTQLIIRAFVEK